MTNAAPRTVLVICLAAAFVCALPVSAADGATLFHNGRIAINEDTTTPVACGGLSSFSNGAGAAANVATKMRMPNDTCPSIR